MDRATIDNMGMSEDQLLLVQAVRDFSRKELLEADRRWDVGEESVREKLPAVAELGLMSLTIPEEYGGLGCDMRTCGAMLREVSYASPSMAVTLSVHLMVGKIVNRFGNAEKKEEWLRSFGHADALAAFAVSEADAGSDPSSSRTDAVRVDGGYRVTGSKMWITNGLYGRWFLVLVRTGLGEDKRGLSALLVDGNDGGIERDEIHGKMGIRGSDTIVLHLNDVFVPAAHLLGEEGEGLKVCLSALDEGRIGIASQALGIAEACLDEMTSYARERVQFGQTIGHFQAIQNMVAQSAVELEAATLLTNRAALLVDSGHRDPQASAMAKLFATESANRIAYRAVQVHGGAGYVNECRVEQLYRDARVTTIYEGTSEIQRHVIARELLKDCV